MAQVRVSAFSVSLDGFGAGVEQSLQQPLGAGGEALHGWMRGTRTFAQMFGQGGGSTGVDDEFAARSMAGVGAWILGRNMFGPVRGPWPDDAWRGWWGDEPPFRCPVFVLTHAARPLLEFANGTSFHFIATTPEAALERALAVADGKDVRIGAARRSSAST